MVKKLLEYFVKKNCKRLKLYVKWKGYNNSFNSWINKKDLVWFYCIKMSKFYPKPYIAFGKGIKVKVDLSNYANKNWFK